MRPPTNSLPGKATNGPKVPTFKPKVEPTTTPLTTVNGNGTPGAAAKGGAALETWGYPVSVSLNPAPTFTFRQSVVYYRPSDQQAAADVAAILGGAVAKPITKAYKAYAAHGLVVVLGKSFTGKLAHVASKSTTGLPSDVTRDSTTYRADFQAANGPANFPVLYPTVRQDASTLVTLGDPADPARTPSRRPAAGTTRCTPTGLQRHRRRPTGGSRRPGSPNAPILANPDQRRKLDGRTYQFYFNGSPHPHDRLHRARHRLLGAEHASRRHVQCGHDRDRAVAEARRVSPPAKSAVGVIGVGYVGLVTATCFADLGHRVVCRDINPQRSPTCAQGAVPIYEPGIERLLERNRDRLTFTLDMAELFEPLPGGVRVRGHAADALRRRGSVARAPRDRRAAGRRRAVRAGDEEHRAGGHRGQGAGRAGRARPRRTSATCRTRSSCARAAPSPTSWSPTGS